MWSAYHVSVRGSAKHIAVKAFYTNVLDSLIQSAKAYGSLHTLSLLLVVIISLNTGVAHQLSGLFGGVFVNLAKGNGLETFQSITGENMDFVDIVTAGTNIVIEVVVFAVVHQVESEIANVLGGVQVVLSEALQTNRLKGLAIIEFTIVYGIDSNTQGVGLQMISLGTLQALVVTAVGKAKGNWLGRLEVAHVVFQKISVVARDTHVVLRKFTAVRNFAFNAAVEDVHFSVEEALVKCEHVGALQLEALGGLGIEGQELEIQKVVIGNQLVIGVTLSAFNVGIQLAILGRGVLHALGFL